MTDICLITAFKTLSLEKAFMAFGLLTKTYKKYGIISKIILTPRTKILKNHPQKTESSKIQNV